MKAIRIHRWGGVETLDYETAPDPVLASPDEVVIDLKAAALNRRDIAIREGRGQFTHPLPLIPGTDGAGVVAEVGALVKYLKPGDRVCIYPAVGCGACELCRTDREFMCGHPELLGEQRDGTYAEYVRVPARACYVLPSWFSFAEGAAFPVVYLTVWRMLVTRAQLKPGESVLIIGAGAVASVAVQLAAAIGAQAIIVSSSDAKLAQALALGATWGVNCTKSDFAREARQITAKRGVDVVVDCVVGHNWSNSLAALARGGRLVTCGAADNAETITNVQRLFWNNLKIFGSTLGSRREFAQVLSFFETTRSKPIVDRAFPLSEAAAAQRHMEELRPFGKIVLHTDA